MRRMLTGLFVILAMAAGDARSGEAPASRAPAPLGLAFGASPGEVEALGVKLDLESDPSYGVAADARNLPKALADAENVSLFFGFDDRLWRIVVTSTEFDDDRYGVRGKARFDELAGLLNERYGKGRRIVREPDSEFMSEPSLFAYSLDKGERILAVEWKSGGVTIELRLDAKFNATFYRLSYEHDALGAAARAAMKDRDKSAL